MKVVMYARKSTEDKHKQIQSIDDQLREVLPVIEENQSPLGRDRGVWWVT
jgi:DNA invertase Pin-like site-specific DNA recombinase